MIGFPPWTPFLIFNKQKENFARCGGRPEALPLDSTTFEKVDETFKRAQSALELETWSSSLTST